MAFIKRKIKKIMKNAKATVPNTIANNPKTSSNISLFVVKYNTKEITNPIKKKINLLITLLNFSLLKRVFFDTALEDFFLEIFLLTFFVFILIDREAYAQWPMLELNQNTL